MIQKRADELKAVIEANVRSAFKDKDTKNDI